MIDIDKSKSQLLEENQQLRLELANACQSVEKCTTEFYKNEEQVFLAMRGVNDGLWDWNLETGDTYYSPRWKSILGYGETELDSIFNTWIRLVHPDDKDLVLEKIQDYLTGQADSFEVEMRMWHKDGYEVFILSRAFLVNRESDGKPVRLVGTHVDITERKKAELFDENNSRILEMIAIGKPTSDIYNAIAVMYEERHPGMRCSMLELHGNKLMHGGAPSLPKEYCDAVHGLENGPNIGSCGTSTYTGKRVINETGMVPAELELEVTEGVVQTNQKNLSIFQDLKDLGVLLAIDDFGTGYSSFASLKHLKVDCLKIDKYFIDDMLNDKKTLLLVNSMIEMGHNLGYGIIAEGVETSEQFNMLKKLDCDAAQGYLFSKPVTANEFSKSRTGHSVFS